VSYQNLSSWHYVSVPLIKFVLLLLAISSALLAQQAAAIYYSVPAADAPELAARGPYAVGVRTLDLLHHDQVDILHFDKSTGKAPLYDRPLKVEIWYPAIIPAGQQEQTTYQMPVPGGRSLAGANTLSIADRALRDAPPVAGERFPLIIVSHGYPGSRYFMSYITANLASKGYVVAAIDHTDSVFDAMRGFDSTLLNRSNDQLFTINALDQLTHQPDSFLRDLVDTGNVAIIGYSMGGYGALTSAGAGYSQSSALMKIVPGGYLQDWAASSAKFQALDRSRIKAIVAIAPWGEQPPYQAWDEQGLASIHIPALFIAGDHDDVAGYAGGIKPAFDRAVHSDRCLLLYENARHNVGGNPAPPEAEASGNFSIMQSFDEPVWRKDRITAINQHFITAFLALYLKHDQSKAAYLHVGPAHSNDGAWALPEGQRDAGAYNAGGNFWKGFQRRWALGLEMTCQSPN
jgi:predicted dienelactone hydrolase